VERASFQEDGGADAGTVIDTVFLNIEDKTFAGAVSFLGHINRSPYFSILACRNIKRKKNITNEIKI
jgi:hypothetical protein